MSATVDQDILDSPEAGPAAVRGAVVRVGGYVASVVLSVVSAAVLLRYLGVDGYGRYATIFALSTVVSGLTEAGTTNIGIREFSVRPKDEHRRLLANLLGTRLTLTGAGVVVAFAFSLLAGYDSDMVLGAALAGIGLVLTATALTLWIPPQAQLRFGQVTILELIRQLSAVGVLVALVAAGSGLALLLGAQIPVAIILLVVTPWIAGRGMSLRPAFDLAEWKRLFADSVPYVAATAIGMLYAYVTIVIMSLVATDTETGLFGAAFRVFMVLTAVPGMLIASAFPVLARAGRDDHERLRYGVQKLFETVLVLATGMALATAAAAPVAIDIVAGADYAGSVPVLQLQSIALFATFFLALGAYALLALRRHMVLVVANALGLVVSTVLTLLLAPDRGAEGAAIANIVGESVVAVMYFAGLFRAGIRPRPGTVPLVALAGGIGAVGFFALGLPALPATILGSVLFGAAALVLKTIPVEALSAFRLPTRFGREG